MSHVQRDAHGLVPLYAAINRAVLDKPLDVTQQTTPNGESNSTGSEHKF